MPSKPESERALISLILHKPELYTSVADKLDPTDFYSIGTQQLWAAFRHLYKKDVDIDIVSVRGALKELEYDPNAGMVQVSEAMEYSLYTSITNLDKYIDDVKHTSILRKIVASTEDYQNRALSPDANPEGLITNLQRDLLGFLESTFDKRPSDLGGILNEVRAELAKAGVGQFSAFKTGFPALDARTGGIIPPQVWILGAYTGVGKTFLTLQLVKNLLEQGANIALFSTEMDRKVCTIRLLSNICGIAPLTLMTRQLTPEEEERLLQAEKVLSQYKNQLHIFDSIFTTEEIRLKCKKIKTQQALDVVFVDFLQNLKGSPNIYERMSNVSIDLQRLSQEVGAAMVLVSQVPNDSADWTKGESINYKGAGEIAHIADVGTWIVRDQKVPSRRWLYLRKVRHGKEGKLALKYEFPAGSVIEEPMVDPTEAPDKMKRYSVDDVDISAYSEGDILGDEQLKI